MDVQDIRNLQEAYIGVYIQEEVDLWVSDIIEEGYDIDEYTDEELLEAFLDERKNEDPKGVANKAGVNKPDAWGAPTKFGQEATRNSLAAGMKGVRTLQRAGVRINRHHRNKFLAHKVHQGWSKAAENSPHQTPEQQTRRKKLINKDLGSFRKNLSKPERDKDVPFVKKAERAVSKKGEFAESYDLYDIILSHLLDEGYAETPEAAEAIMVNMSEDWREDIVEAAAEMTPQKRDFMQRQKAKLIDSGKIEQAKKVNAATYYTDVDASRKKETNNRRRGGNKPNPATPDTSKRKYRSGGFSKKPEETERDYLDRRWDVAQYLRSKK
jgi:hypothetical protein